MTYIPDTRDPIEKKPFSKKEEANYYYEGLLNDRDKREMDCYDYGVQDCTNAFDNLDIAFEFAEDRLEDEIPEEQETYFTEEEEEFLLSDRVIKFLKTAMLLYVENQRDEWVVSKIDCYSDTPQEKEISAKYKAMEKDFKTLSKEDFNKKYPTREYNENGHYAHGNED